MKYKSLLLLISFCFFTNVFSVFIEMDDVTGGFEKLKKSLVEFDRSRGDLEDLPTMLGLKTKNRKFVAYMDSFGIDRYFIFEDNQDIKKLVTSVRCGQAYEVIFYYCDEEINFISKKNVTKKVVFFVDSKEDEELEEDSDSDPEESQDKCEYKSSCPCSCNIL